MEYRGTGHDQEATTVEERLAASLEYASSVSAIVLPDIIALVNLSIHPGARSVKIGASDALLDTFDCLLSLLRKTGTPARANLDSRYGKGSGVAEEIARSACRRGPPIASSRLQISLSHPSSSTPRAIHLPTVAKTQHSLYRARLPPQSNCWPPWSQMLLLSYQTLPWFRGR